MIFEPGILDAAHGKGIKFLDDLNHDGKIDQKDLTMAIKAKSSVGQVETAAKKAVVTK
jgi:hypothetical protein